jgi:glycosyltransferase involved in cell wall biosynthesis
MGEVRPYKGVDVLLERLRNSDLDVDLIVAGRPMDSAIEEALRATAGDDDRIHLDLRYIPDDAVAALMCAADWAVLPYRRITTSGSLLLALGFGIPVIAPAHPAIMEVAATKALETFADDDDLIPAIRRAIRRDRAVAANAAIESTATLDWSEIGAATARFFREITAAPAAQSPQSSAS